MKVEAHAVVPPPLRTDPTRAAARADASNPTRDATRFDLKHGVTKEFLQSALTTEIGKNVQDVLGKHGIALADAAGLDWSAEATSDRIVAGTTAMLGVFARQNPELDDKALLDRFETTLRGGIDKGYRDALAILEAVSTFSPEVKALGQRTIAMTHDKLTAWFAERRAGLDVATSLAGSASRDVATSLAGSASRDVATSLDGAANASPASDAPPWPPLSKSESSALV